MSLLLSQLGDISEQGWWREVTLDVSLLEWFDLARENVVKREGQAVMALDGFRDHVERKQWGFCTSVNELGLARDDPSSTYEHIVATRSFRPFNRSTSLTMSGTYYGERERLLRRG